MVDKKNIEDGVAARSADADNQAGSTGVKDFVVLKRDWNDGDVRPGFHEDNIAAARQYLMHQGIRPTEDGQFVGAEDHADPSSVILHYSFAAELGRDTKRQPRVRPEHKDANSAEAKGE